MRLRVKFEKRSPLSFSSHRDVVRIVQRAIAAADVPIAFSNGFHPHMRMSFGPPLKTGWEGFDEYLDVQFETPVESFYERCNEFLPEGLRFLASSEVVSGAPKLANDISAASYQVRVRLDELESTANLDADSLARQSQETVSRLGGNGDAGELTPHVFTVTARTSGDHLDIEYTTGMCSGRVVSPQEVLDVFVQTVDLPTPAKVTRTVQYVARNGEYLSPLNEEVIQGIT
jgi:radical SAM-linked protein